MLVKDHMTSDPVTFSRDRSVSDALALMRRMNIGCLPVISENGKLTGLITRSLIRKFSEKQKTDLDRYQLNYLLSATRIKDIMIKDVITAFPDEPLEKAAALMRECGVSTLVIIDQDSTVAGILTRGDILRAMSYTEN